MLAEHSYPRELFSGDLVHSLRAVGLHRQAVLEQRAPLMLEVHLAMVRLPDYAGAAGWCRSQRRPPCPPAVPPQQFREQRQVHPIESAASVHVGSIAESLE